ncbi:MAG: hypothetical protein Q7U04_09415 [Bacteriovorax sp.]|nr:hypothetical protein [Bacteriovorax sp.]
MKIKKLNLITFSAVLIISACANNQNQYTPQTYRDSYEASYNPVDTTRTPSSLQDCFNNVLSFFKKKRLDPVTDLEVPHSEIILKNISESMALSPTRYPKGFEEIKGSQIQYGFESEYLHEETEAFFLNYMPDLSIYNGTKESWLSLKTDERLKFIDKNNEKIFPYREKGKMIKISNDPELATALPDSFVYDAGHFEIVLDPMDSAEEMINKIKIINKHFGIGSMQVTISNPIDKNLLKEKNYRNEFKSEILGYYNFMNDFDTINKLGSGYERYLIDQNAETIKSFNHPWLGPMTKFKHDRLQQLIENIADQKKFSEQELKDISYMVVSHKFIGGLSFRPDVAYKKGRIASEVRDCHQNLKCIENRIIRETYFLMKGKENFHNFSTLSTFDSELAFRALPKEVQSMLKLVFPSYGSFKQKELELYRNFSYPLRDWSNHVISLNAPELTQQIETAKLEYIESLKEITKELQTNTIDEKMARVKIMGSLGKFSKSSGLQDAMKSQYNHLINPSELKNFDKLKFALWLRSLLQIS